jgi:hypothetical protein
MSWLSEFGSEYAVPESILRREAAGLLNDVSWHNDTAPSFEIVGAPLPHEEVEENTWRISVEHPDPYQREIEGPRFVVLGPDYDYDGNLLDFFETDNVRELWPWIEKKLDVDMSLGR